MLQEYSNIPKNCSFYALDSIFITAVLNRSAALVPLVAAEDTEGCDLQLKYGSTCLVTKVIGKMLAKVNYFIFHFSNLFICCQGSFNKQAGDSEDPVSVSCSPETSTGYNEYHSTQTLQTIHQTCAFIPNSYCTEAIKKNKQNLPFFQVI